MDYKKYSLENLENWMHDAMSCGEATPQEIYDTILGVVKDNYYTYKQKASEANELLALLNGNGRELEKQIESHKKFFFACDKDNSSPECKGAWNDFWEEYYYPEESNFMKVDGYSVNGEGHSQYWYEYNRNDANRKNPFTDNVNRWVLPVQVDGLTGECYINLPDDLLERAGLHEGDMVHWIDRKDGSFELRKVTKPLGTEEC